MHGRGKEGRRRERKGRKGKERRRQKGGRILCHDFEWRSSPSFYFS